MTVTKYASVAALALFAFAPAHAFTFHPATPAEMKQTDDLNAQSLANARAGQQPATTQASFSNSDTTTAASPTMKKKAKANATMNGGASTNDMNTKAGAGSEVTTPPAQTDTNTNTSTSTTPPGQ